MKVLVTYATAYGSTRSIAENIARVLAERHTVTVQPVDHVSDLASYDAVVIGGALHRHTWLPEASEFLVRHADLLADRPVWLFGVGTPEALPRALRSATRRAEANGLALAIPRSIQPRDTRLFSGLVPRERFPNGPSRLWWYTLGAHHGDFRPWPEIMTWSREISAALEPATTD